jgi:(2Fe-2S) ferredoxin
MIGDSESRQSRVPSRAVSIARRTLCVLLLIWLAAVSAVAVPATLRFLLQRLYTPPALTRSKLRAYQDFLSFVKSRRSSAEVVLNRYGDVGLGLQYYSLDDPDACSRLQMEHQVSTIEIDKLKRIVHEFRRVGCEVACKHGPVVLFRPERSMIAPTSAEVLYSLDGGNPNEDNDRILVRRKPFVSIGGRWYVSRVSKQYRSDDPHEVTALPNSWIDRSLNTDKLNLDEPIVEGKPGTHPGLSP